MKYLILSIIINIFFETVGNIGLGTDIKKLLLLNFEQIRNDKI